MMRHGGKREGAGRKPQADKVERVTFYVGASQVVWLEEYTARHGYTNLSASVRAILYQRQLSET